MRDVLSRRALFAMGFGGALALVPGAAASAGSVMAAGRDRIDTGETFFPFKRVDPGVPLRPASVIVVTAMTEVPVPLSVQINSGADVFYVHAAEHDVPLPDPLPFSWAVLRG
jgi:hypothetical protein